ncbi:PLP-dependent aminotransferase family protein, partial [bacterium]|nr:PLP-dependent aminotransferase family protein [bacterium]
ADMQGAKEMLEQQIDELGGISMKDILLEEEESRKQHLEQLKEIANKLMTEKPEIMLQYTGTGGYMPLKEEIIKFMAHHGSNLEPENILITTGGQQGIDLPSKIFVDPSDPVFVEIPSYVGALNSLASTGAKFVGIPMDENGIKTDILEEKIKYLNEIGEHYKLLYIVPDYQNPSGVSLSLDRREKLVELSDKYNFIILEDCPYTHLRYDGEEKPSLFKLSNSGNILGLYSFSKILSPGLRLGWVCGNKDIIRKLEVLKQSVDVCCSTFIQGIVAEYMKSNLLESHIGDVVKEYKTKKDLMLKMLSENMPKGVTWTTPSGGLFLWITLPENIDSESMLKKAIEHKVTYVPGYAFHHNSEMRNCLRVNFSYPTLEQIEKGVKSLAEVIKKEIKNLK